MFAQKWAFPAAAYQGTRPPKFSSKDLEHEMNEFEPTRSVMNQSRRSEAKSIPHQIRISSALVLGPAEMGREFAAMSSAPPRDASLLIINVDNGDLIYILPQTLEVVTSLQVEQEVECAA